MKYFIALAFLCLFYNGNTQRFAVNASFTDTGVLSIEGSKTYRASIPSLKGKFIILETFSSNCMLCFRMLPKINLLQNKFRDQMQFILVGYEDEHIREIYEKFRQKMKLELQVAFDSAFHRRMSVPYNPCYIWIDDQGIVKAITGPGDITEANMEKFISGRVFNYTLAQRSGRHDPSTSFLFSDNFDSSYLFSSIITRWQPSMPHFAPMQLNYSEHGPFSEVLGMRASGLYKYAFFGKFFWDSDDSLYGKAFRYPLIVDENGEHLMDEDTLYCYGIYNNGRRNVSPNEVLKNDLKAYFGYEAKKITRKMPCWEIIQTGTRTVKTKGGQPVIRSSRTGCEFKNVPFSQLVSFLSYGIAGDRPFINKTGINHNIDIVINAPITDFDLVRKELLNSGLDIREGTTDMQVIVLHR
jgi:thiol-disulfide isomerase/thioredoxin